MRSSELSRLAAVTAAVAASTTEVIWELVRELVRVLLVLRDETLVCLELLVEERLALSSLISLAERETRVPVPVPSSVVVDEESLPEPSSLLVHPRTRINDSRRIDNEKKNEKLSFPTLLDIKINLSIFNTYKVFESGNSALMATNIELLTNQKS